MEKDTIKPGQNLSSEPLVSAEYRGRFEVIKREIMQRSGGQLSEEAADALAAQQLQSDLDADVIRQSEEKRRSEVSEVKDEQNKN